MMSRLNRLLCRPPCPKCPYTLGQVFTLRNPCPACRQNGYATYELFLRAPGGTLQGAAYGRDSAER